MKSSRFALIALIAPTLALAQGVQLNTITKVEVKGSTIVITGNKKPNFTTFTMTDPPRLVIDISEAVFSGVPDEMQVGNGVVTAIKTASYGSDASAIARVLIGFEKDFENPDYQTSDTKLVVTVPGGEAPAVAQAEPKAEPPAASADAEKQAQAKAEQERQAKAAADAEAARQQQEQQAQAKAEQERKQQEAQAAAQSDAERKRQEQEAAAEAKRQAEADRQAKAQAAADEKARKQEEAKAEAQRLREEREAAKQAAAEEKAREQEEAKAEAQRLREERELAKRAAAEEKARKAEEARAAREERVASRETAAAPETDRGESAAESGLSVSNRRKTVALVGFKQQATTSRVFVRTDEPARYTVQRGGDKSVVLELENTRLGVDNNDRPLDTSYFDTAVAMVDPQVGPTRTVRIEIQLKEDVPYETRQEGNEIYLEFQRPARR